MEREYRRSPLYVVPSECDVRVPASSTGWESRSCSDDSLPLPYYKRSSLFKIAHFKREGKMLRSTERD